MGLEVWSLGSRASGMGSHVSDVAHRVPTGTLGTYGDYPEMGLVGIISQVPGLTIEVTAGGCVFRGSGSCFGA